MSFPSVRGVHATAMGAAAGNNGNDPTRRRSTPGRKHKQSTPVVPYPKASPRRQAAEKPDWTKTKTELLKIIAEQQAQIAELRERRAQPVEFITVPDEDDDRDDSDDNSAGPSQPKVLTPAKPAGSMSTGNHGAVGGTSTPGAPRAAQMTSRPATTTMPARPSAPVTLWHTPGPALPTYNHGASASTGANEKDGGDDDGANEDEWSGFD